MANPTIWRFLISKTFLLGILLMTSVFLLELFTGIMAGTTTYILIALVVLWVSRTEKHIIALGVVASALIIAGFFFSPHESVTLSSIRLNRVITFSSIWLAVYVAIHYKRAVDKKEKLSEQLQALFEYSTEGILFLDAKGDIILSNPWAAKLLGYETEKLKGMAVTQLFPESVNPEYVQFLRGFIAGEIRQDKSRQFEVRAYRQNNAVLAADVALSTFRSGGATMTIVFIQDATDRKERERLMVDKVATIARHNLELEEKVRHRTQELEQALDHVKSINADLLAEAEARKVAEKELRKSQQLYTEVARNFPEGIIGVLDKNLKFVIANGEEFSALGFRDGEVAGKNFIEGMQEQSATQCLSNLQKVYSGAKTKFEIPLMNKHYSVTSVPLLSTGDQVNEALVVIKNITQRKKLEEELMKNLEKERTLNMLKSRFVTAASHEFRTPLTTILSSASLLENYKGAQLEVKKEVHLKRIKGSVHSLTELLNDFLSLNNLEEGKVSAVNSVFSLNDMLKQLLRELEVTKKDGQNIALLYTVGTSDYISSDRELLKTILTNLLSNAIKYSPSNSRIDLTVFTDHRELVLEVRDLGIGIPQEEQPHIFDRFFRAQNANDYGGTGLGLNIVKKYVTLLKGTVDFESKLDEGTTFRVRIPLVKV